MTKKIQKLKMQIVPILKKAGVIRSGIFGSFARGEETPESDLDILVELEKDKTFFDLVGLKSDLEEKLNIKVDIGTYNSIRPSLKERILNDEERII